MMIEQLFDILYFMNVVSIEGNIAEKRNRTWQKKRTESHRFSFSDKLGEKMGKKKTMSNNFPFVYVLRYMS